MPSIKIKRGTRAQLTAAAEAAGLKAGELYHVTDEGRVELGTAVGASVALAKKSEVDERLSQDFSGLASAGTVDGTETIAINKAGAKRTTAQAILDWILARANTWTSLQVFRTAGFSSQHNAGNSGTSITLNFANGQKQLLTLTNNATVTLSFPAVGNYQVRLAQDATGNRSVTWSGVSRYIGSATAPAINLVTNSSTLVSIYYDGTNAWLAASKVNA